MMSSLGPLPRGSSFRPEPALGDKNELQIVCGVLRSVVLAYLSQHEGFCL